MIIKQNKELVNWRIEQLRKHLFHSRKNDLIHASEIDFNDKKEGCLLKSFYRRTIDPSIPQTKEQLLNFCTGWGIEGFIVFQEERQKPKEKDGIICSIDALTPFGISEVKATDFSLTTFNPKKSASQWINRGIIYSYVWEKESFNLEVFFNRGNYKFGDKGIKKDLKAWNITLNKKDLNTTWAIAQGRKDILRKAIDSNLPIAPEFIKPFQFNSGLECLYCELSSVCYWHRERENENIK